MVIDASDCGRYGVSVTGVSDCGRFGVSDRREHPDDDSVSLRGSTSGSKFKLRELSFRIFLGVDGECETIDIFCQKGFDLLETKRPFERSKEKVLFELKT